MFDVSSVCGSGTSYKDGKCVSILQNEDERLEKEVVRRQSDLRFTDSNVILKPGDVIEGGNLENGTRSKITCQKGDNALMCGEGTSFRDGRCMSTIEHVKCGPRTVLSHGECTIDYGDKVDPIFLNFGPEVTQSSSDFVWDMTTIDKIPANITLSAKGNVRGTFEDTAAGVMMRRTPDVPDHKQGSVYGCFYHASKKLNNETPSGKTNDLYDALDGTHNQYWDVIYGRNGIIKNCLRSHNR